ncbi:MAG TPA: M36 family metallopeptidase, partial [Chthoniobacterales bacterium]
MKSHTTPLRFAARISALPAAARGAILLLAALATGPLSAAPRSDAPQNFDRRAANPTGAKGAVSSQAEAQAAGDLLRSRVETAVIDADPILGTPKFIRATRGFLTGRDGEGVAVSAQTAATLSPADPNRAIIGFVEEYRAVFGFGREALEAADITREDVTAHSGIRTVVWQQRLDGLRVFESVFKASQTAKGELINLGSTFVPEAAAAADRGVPDRARVQATPSISPEAAIAAAAQNVGVALSPAETKAADAARGPEKFQRFTAPGLNGAEAELVWLPMDAATMRLSWRVVVVSRASGRMFQLLVDAQTAAIVIRQNLTHDLETAQYKVFVDESPTPSNPDLSTPSTAQPGTASRQLVTIDALDTTGSPNGWINDGDNTTNGNNVRAHLDTNNNDVADANSSPTGSPSRVFNFDLDLTKKPADNQSASTVQLFYWCNFAHDKLYALGFTETAGNFQVSNFSRGGIGNDPVEADNQDASVSNTNSPGDGVQFNNANFSTPPEPPSAQYPNWKPRMQMYLFDGLEVKPSGNTDRLVPDRDGSFDAEIVLHEYVHGLSNRLVGGGVTMSALQATGMGEGWSDFYALSLLSKAGQNVDGNYAAAAYATRALLGTSDYANYYYGIRRYPYSTNLDVNPLTYNDIDPAQADLPSNETVPINPVFATSDADETHAMGEVWCAMLWEARANFIRKLGFAEGNQKILQIVTDGMKLAPANPNFIEARDAILQAETVLTEGAHHGELVAAFAKRGLGPNATSPASTTTAGVVQSFREDTRPVVTITKPGNNSSIGAFTALSGTATDESGIAGSTVNVNLYHTGTSQYWTGTGWSSNPVSLSVPVKPDGTWSYTSTLPKAQNSTLRTGQYSFSASTSDIFGNSTLPQAGVNNIFFTVDASPPSVAITSPPNGATIKDQMFDFQGTASDSAGLDRVVLFIRRNSDSKYWNGSGWVDDPREANLAATPPDAQTGAWSCSAARPIPGYALHAMPNGSYNYIAIAIDKAGNETQTDSQVTIDFHRVMTWRGDVSGDWDNAANWDYSGLAWQATAPDENAIVVINNGRTVSSNQNRTVHSVRLLDGRIQFTNGSSRTLTTTNRSTWSGGSFGGTWNVAPGATLELIGDRAKFLSDGSVMNNFGKISWGGPGPIQAEGNGFTDNPVINNKAGGTFEVRAGGNLFSRASLRSGTPVFNNEANAKFVKVEPVIVPGIVGTNLLQNADAEAGSAAADYSSIVAPSGWTTEGSLTSVLYSIGGPNDLNAADATAVNGGGRYFAGGPGPLYSYASQLLDVSALSTQIDAGQLTA